VLIAPRMFIITKFVFTVKPHVTPTLTALTVALTITAFRVLGVRKVAVLGIAFWVNVCIETQSDSVIDGFLAALI
jgi:hypothetical protein